MNEKLIFSAACYGRSCGDCSLRLYNCSLAPIDMIIKQARRNYIKQKQGRRFNVYNRTMEKEFGPDYAKEFMKTKAMVV